MSITIQVHERVNFTSAEVEKHQKACEEAVKVLNSKRFKELFLKEKLTNKQGFTNLEIYEKLMSGSDKKNPEADRDIDVFVTMYYKNNKVVGYTYPSIKETYLNRKFFSSYDVADVACNLIHEYLHKVGFGHDSASEDSSIPYAIGYLVEKCIREMWLNPGLYDDTEAPIEEPIEEPVEDDEPEDAKKLYCKRLWYTFWTKKVCWYE